MRPRHESNGVHNRCQLVQIRDPGAILLTPERCAEALCKQRLLPCRHEVRRGHGVGQRVTAYPLTRHITFRFYVVAHICRILVREISIMTGCEAGVSVRAWFCDACNVGLVVG